MSHITVAAAGALLVLLSWRSAIRTVFMPRQRSALGVRWAARMVAPPPREPARVARGAFGERILDYCAPLSLLLMGLTWLASATAGFAMLAWGAVGASLGGGVAGFFALRGGGSVLVV